MPTRARVQEAARRAFQRWPGLQRKSFRLLDLVYVAALWPFRRPRRRGSMRERRDLVSCTGEYNAAAERYFAAQRDTAYLLGKPFSDPANAAQHLIDAGVLMKSMRLRPGDVVAEIGAGTCWLSHMLNRYGCRTIAIDVSPTALALGRTFFEGDSRTDWLLRPEFVPYDGRTIPLHDETCDRIVINDAFHHIPNQRELLLEMWRILRRDGVVGMSEPGLGHGSVEPSVREAASTGVLENELVLEDLDELARGCGFRAVHVVVASASALHEIPANRLGAFMGGRGFTAYWKQLCGALERHYYLLLYKGDPAPTTRRPAVLSAGIDLLEPRGALRVRPGEQATLTLQVTNHGSTLWLADQGPGWTRLGAHLYGERGSVDPIEFDWHRAALPADVPPGSRQRLDVTLPALTGAGRYHVVFDLVIEGQVWFAAHGSATLAIELEIV